MFLKKNNYNFFIFTIISLFCGTFICGLPFNLSYHFLPILIIIVLWIFVQAKNRFDLTIFLLCYHITSAHSLILGYSSFFNSSFFFGIILVILASVFFSSIVSYLSFNTNKFFQLLIINFLWCLPILIVGWSSPLFAAGYFMPGFGWLGLILFVPLVYFIFSIKWQYKLLIFFCIFNTTFIKNNNVNIKKNISVINTNFHNNIIKDTYHIYKKILNTFQRIKKINNKEIIVLPEDGLPCFNKNTKNIFIKEFKKIINPFAFTGTTTCLDNRLKSGVLFLDKKKIQFIYLQRQPMPYAMYLPFSSSYFINWENNGLFKFNEKKYGLFVCFETVLIWTYIQTMLYKPDILISFNSVYWDKTGKVKIIQNQLMHGISRLFNVSYQGVWNY